MEAALQQSRCAVISVDNCYCVQKMRLHTSGRYVTKVSPAII